jgi:hypothetical protein
METLDRVVVEMLTPIRNDAVVRLPGRRFPGVLMQGDTLAILVAQARAVCSRLTGHDEDLIDDARLLKESLEDIQARYEAALFAHGIELPYTKES